MDFIQALTQVGGEVWSVGGAVRDKVLNQKYGFSKAVKDYDLLVRHLTVPEIEKQLAPFGLCKEVGKAFGVVNFHLTDSEWVFEIALPRIEKSTGDKYRDFEIIADPEASVETDLSRRDATINAMAYPVTTFPELLQEELHLDRIYDPFRGLQDLEAHLWKAVGDPAHRFLEDPTRILRGIRQCSTLGFALESQTQRVIEEQPDLLHRLEDDSLSRLSTELVKIIQGDYVVNWVEFLFRSGLAKALSLPYSETQIDSVLQSLTRAVAQKSSYVVRMVLLLAPLNQEVKNWSHKYFLSASLTFEKKYVPPLVQIVTQLPEMMARRRTDPTYLETPVSMRRLVQSVQKSQYDFEATRLLLETYLCLTGEEGAEIWLQYEAEKEILLNSQQLGLSGGRIRELNPEISGKEIGKIKQWLFEEVTEGRVAHEVEALEHWFLTRYPTMSSESSVTKVSSEGAK